MSPSLASGRTIAHFRVVALLGEGGMGQVYKAWDSRLDRPVALKVLPTDRLADEERRRRFVREAQAASALAHPNIVTVYEIGEAASDGADATLERGETIHYIAMELVEGRTLRQLIHEDRTDLRTLLGYLAQAAAGIGRAHEAGVVHRDLKPDNVMVSRDGYTKVLDFGLAKLDALADPAGSALSRAPNATVATAEGTLMGTVGYMSPEQVQGRGVDHRTDVFAFGCLLYEAATRRRPFVADSSIDELHKILHDDPPPIEELDPTVPSAVRRLVGRCLAKDPERRLQSMKDLALALEDLVADFPSAAAASGSGASRSGVVTVGAGVSDRASRRSRARVTALAVGGLLLVVALLGWLLRERSADRAAAAHFQGMQIEPLTSDGTVAWAALSPDGRYLAHTRAIEGQTGLWVRQLATGSEVEVLPAGALRLAGVTFTPDGEYLYFRRADPDRAGYHVLWRVPTLGGEPRRVAWDVDAVPAFAPDGSRLAFPRSSPHARRSAILVANADGSGLRELAALEEPGHFLRMQGAWTADGTRIVAARVSGPGLEPIRLVTLDAATGAEDPLPGGEGFLRISNVAALPDGGGFVLAGRRAGEASDQLWMIDGNGEVTRVSNDLNDYSEVSVSADGETLVAVLAESVSHLYAAPAADPAALRQLTRGTREASLGVAVGPAGEVVFQRRRAEGTQLWTTRVEGGEPRRLTSEGIASSPRLSADGAVLVARMQLEDGTPHVWRVDRETGALVERLTSGTGASDFDLAPDGRWLVYVSAGREELLRIDLAAGTPTRLATGVRRGPRISPDGGSIAFGTFEPVEGEGRARIRVLDAGGRAVASVPWELGPFTWHPDGRSLVMVRVQGGAANLWRVPVAGGEPVRLARLEAGHVIDLDWSPDGDWIALTRGRSSSDAVRIRGFR